MILVGEPTSVNRLGDMVKIGRRGSVNIWIDVPGTQGHVAYPHLADNPIPKLIEILAAIDAVVLDEGNDWFQPSNIEITDIEVGNGATNVIPASARARLIIRFNDQQSGAELVAMIECIAHDVKPNAKVLGKISGEAFLTPPGDLSGLVAEAIHAETGVMPGAVDHRRHVGRPLPVGAVPGGRIRPAQRDDAQAGRSGRGGRFAHADRHLSRDIDQGFRLSLPPAKAGIHEISIFARSPQDHIDRARAAMADMRGAQRDDLVGVGRISEPVGERSADRAARTRVTVHLRQSVGAGAQPPRHHQQHPRTAHQPAADRFVEQRLRRG